MNENKTIAILGGDMRQLCMAKFFREDGYTVKVIGFDKNNITDPAVTVCTDLEDTLKDVFLAVLPLPFSKDGIYINTPLSSDKILFSDFCRLLPKNALCVGGMLNEKAYNAAGHNGFKIFDYFERPELIIENTIPTAEGAIQIAMEETDRTLHGQKVLVLGYGRVSKLLSSYLKFLGCDVTVAMRKHSDMALLDTVNIKGIFYETLPLIMSSFDIVFNTVPSLVLTKERLSLSKPDCLIIDLASKPGGVDFSAASILPRKAIWALSLPGKVAPVTSGEIIKNTIINILSEEV